MQRAYLKASNTNEYDGFGNSVAISGDVAVVTSRYESSRSIGVDGNETDNSAEGAGAAYVFARVGHTWNQIAYLKASNTDSGDDFGYSAAVDSNTVIVGHRVSPVPRLLSTEAKSMIAF